MAQSGPSSAVDRTLVAVEVLVGVGVVAAIVGKAYGPAPTVVFVFAAMSLAFTVYTVGRMLTALRDPSLDVTGKVEDEHRAALETEKLIILQGIKELEADAAIGKVAEEDYAHLRAKSEADALRIIRTLKDDDERWLARARDLVRDRLGAHALGEAPAKTAAEAAPAAPAEAAPSTSGPTAFEGLFDDTPVEVAEGRCGACSTDNPEDARYCVGCGRPVAAEGVAA